MYPPAINDSVVQSVVCPIVKRFLDERPEYRGRLQWWNDADSAEMGTLYVRLIHKGGTITSHTEARTATAEEAGRWLEAFLAEWAKPDQLTDEQLGRAWCGRKGYAPEYVTGLQSGWSWMQNKWLPNCLLAEIYPCINLSGSGWGERNFPSEPLAYAAVGKALRAIREQLEPWPEEMG